MTTIVNDEVEDNNTPALVTMVKGAHPNPFNPMTTVKFSVARTQHVTLAVYNMSGQRVATLVDGTYEAGEHPVQWNGTDLPDVVSAAALTSSTCRVRTEFPPARSCSSGSPFRVDLILAPDLPVRGLFHVVIRKIRLF